MTCQPIFFAEKIYEKESEELKLKYEEQIALLKIQIEKFSTKLEEEHEAMAQKFEEERDQLEEELARTIRDELEVLSNLCITI